MMEHLRNALKHVAAFFLPLITETKNVTTLVMGGGKKKWNQMFSKDTSKNVSGDLRMMLTWQQILSRSSAAQARAEKTRLHFLPVIYKDTNHQHHAVSPFNTSGTSGDLFLVDAAAND